MKRIAYLLALPLLLAADIALAQVTGGGVSVGSAVSNSAVGQFPANNTQTPTVVDIAPVVNTIIQFASAVVSLVLIPLFWSWWRKKAKEWQLEDLKIEEQYRNTLDQGAVAAIGAALNKYKVEPGRVTLDVKSRIVADATNALAASFPGAFNGLGVKDHLDKARQIIESRLGLTDAAAAGTPVMGVTTPPAAVNLPSGGSGQV